MNWQKLHDELYYIDCSWRNIYVQGTNEIDWKKWIAFVNENYEVEFFNGEEQSTESQIDYKAILNYWRGETDCSSSAIITRKFT
ncbi:MAG: hypothetical protein M3Y85_10065 [Bacteroidota bacterium]|nr:hypothetical protein [Bacteroidota bacterium]